MDEQLADANLALADLDDGADDALFEDTMGALKIPAIPVVNLSGLIPSGEFARTFRFGMIDNSALVLAALFGLSLEDYIAEKVGVPGYGVLIGATVGNAVSDGIAGIPEGRDAALGYFTGAMLPVLPLAIAVGMKKPATGGTATALKAVSAALLVLAFMKKTKQRGA
jgi:hypothetical protein